VLGGDAIGIFSEKIPFSWAGANMMAEQWEMNKKVKKSGS